MCYLLIFSLDSSIIHFRLSGERKQMNRRGLVVSTSCMTMGSLVGRCSLRGRRRRRRSGGSDFDSRFIQNEAERLDLSGLTSLHGGGHRSVAAALT